MSTRNEKVLFPIKVGPVVYTVRKVESLKVEGQAFGVCDNLDKEIHVRAGMQKEQELQVLLHELLHGVVNEYAIRNAAKIEPDEEEVIVDLIALGLTQALCSSPQLRKYINEMTKGS